MKRRYVLASMGAFTASGSFAVGSSALSSTEAARQTNVDVVGDENAYLQLDYMVAPDENGRRSVTTCTDSVDLFSVTSNFSESLESLDVTIESVENGDSDYFEIRLDNLDEEPDLAVLEVNNDARDGSERTVTIEIEATGSGFHIEATRVFNVRALAACFCKAKAIVKIQRNKEKPLSRVTFDYELSNVATVEFSVDGQREKETDDKEKVRISPEEDLPVDITANIIDGNQYTKEIPSDAENKDEFIFVENSNLC